MEKIKEIFWKNIFKIGFFKKWYIGNEYVKNTPTVYINESKEIEGITFVNVTLRMSEDSKLNNCTVKSTLKLARYF